MANLAIKGHNTRGREVIEILEMFGGKISHECKHEDGFDTRYAYFIDTDEKFFIDGFLLDDENLTKFSIFTLEEFLEKFPYKAGDKVMTDDGDKANIVGMVWNNDVNDIFYETQIYNEVFKYPKELLQPYKKETMEKDKNNWAKWDLPEGYEFQDKEGNVINTDVIKLVKKQPQYPKTYEECLVMTSYDKEERILYLLEKFKQLLICRSAYWKIAGEQMGLGKPWKPDFTNNDEERYGIYTLVNKVEKDFCGVGDVNTILVFPTEEMRDAFYENFRDLIEICKGFL